MQKDRKNALLLVWMLGAILLAGCGGMTRSGELSKRGVSLFAFNYTDRGISHIYVNGAWLGGADAYSNSGSAAGLLAPSDRSKAHAIEVEWTVSDYYNLETNKYERRSLENRKAMVTLAYPYPENPNRLVFHFYPDGRVEAELVEGRVRMLNSRRIPPPEGYKR